MAQHHSESDYLELCQTEFLLFFIRKRKKNHLSVCRVNRSRRPSTTRLIDLQLLNNDPDCRSQPSLHASLAVLTLSTAMAYRRGLVLPSEKAYSRGFRIRVSCPFWQNKCKTITDSTMTENMCMYNALGGLGYKERVLNMYCFLWHHLILQRGWNSKTVRHNGGFGLWDPAAASSL